MYLLNLDRRDLFYLIDKTEHTVQARRVFSTYYSLIGELSTNGGNCHFQEDMLRQMNRTARVNQEAGYLM